jgi:hypothetical protein
MSSRIRKIVTSSPFILAATLAVVTMLLFGLLMWEHGPFFEGMREDQTWDQK